MLFLGFPYILGINLAFFIGVIWVWLRNRITIKYIVAPYLLIVCFYLDTLQWVSKQGRTWFIGSSRALEWYYVGFIISIALTLAFFTIFWGRKCSEKALDGASITGIFRCISCVDPGSFIVLNNLFLLSIIWDIYYIGLIRLADRAMSMLCIYIVGLTEYIDTLFKATILLIIATIITVLVMPKLYKKMCLMYLSKKKGRISTQYIGDNIL
ncbi:MAG: hypothetical protein J7K21_00890 [Desulfurococcales archaeon]|nr:hypothetical protein [Desulfurococcales archaeon]